MEKLKLDSVLLFAFVIPFIMTVRISSGETPYWLFGVIFLSLLSYLALDLFNIKEKLFSKIKLGFLWAIIIVVLGSAFTSSIVVRHQTSPNYMIHDIIVQQEAGIRYLLDGRNPYSETYFGTPLEDWHYSDTEINPALYHFVMQPSYLYFALPFYFASNLLFGFFDARLPLFFLLALTLAVTTVFVKNQDKKREFLVFLAFVPSMLYYTLEGRSDIFMFAFLLISLVFLHLRKHFLSAFFLAVAFSVKQSAWPILPLYAGYLYFKTKDLRKVFSPLLVFGISFLVFLSPFLLWDFRAFYESTVSYLSGTSEHSYPISGYGFGKILSDFDLIRNENTYFPFHYLQALFGLPALYFLFRFLKKNPKVNFLIISYGIFLMIFWYFSRYFNNSHLGFLSLVFITAYYWPEEKST